jgi:CheY-like chemotaxis protein/HAMP domain-containing protein
MKMYIDKDLKGFERFKYWLKAKLYIGVGKSLLLWFLAISFVPLASVSFLNYLYAYLGLTVVAEKSLQTTSQLRVEYLNTFFKEVANYLEVQSQLESNVDFFESLESSYNAHKASNQDFINSEKWKELTQAKRKDFKAILDKQAYTNIFYLDKDGTIIFNAERNKDLGTNLFLGNNSNSLFSKTCKEIMRSGKILFSDLEHYPQNSKMVSGFFGAPVSNRNGDVIGILAVQVTMGRINNIIQDDVGLGETGEAYLVGPDLLMRSASRFGGDSIILKQVAKTDKTLTWQKYIKNKNDKQYIINNKLDIEEISSYPNINGNYVLGIYRNLDYLQTLGVDWVLIEEIENNEAFAYAQQLSDIAKISFIVTIIIVFIIAFLVTRRFVKPIKIISAWSKEVAIGKLHQRTIKAPKNEVGEMVDTFNILVESLRSYASISESAALGDYSKSVTIRSEEDVLGKSMNEMVESFQKVVQQANSIAKGDYSTNIVPRSEKDTFGIALYQMTKTLRTSSQKIKEEDWLKTGISQLEGKLSGLKDVKKLSSEIISFLTTYLDAQIGIIYINEKNTLQLTSTYAFRDTGEKFKQFEFGEGLIGQVALDKKSMLLTDPNPNLPIFDTGIERKQPINYFIAPFIFEEKVMGVIQIGSLQAFDDMHQKFVGQVLDSIAVAMNTVQTHSRVENLLGRTQDQAGELQQQQEELRQANEELEEQTKALKLSEENLKNQQEELKVINEELEERTNDLEMERDNIRKKNNELEVVRDEIKKKAVDLEQASKYKSEFMANMSHELRTPLNSILVLSQLLSDNKKTHLDKKEIEFAKTINSSGNDLLELINEILDLSKVESGKMDLHIENTYPYEITDFIKRNFKPLMDKKGLELKIVLDENLPEFIQTDSQRVMQIIKNLFSNALKFTSHGSITLKIAKPELQTKFSNTKLTAENAIGISIIDTGIGIPDEKKSMIFEAFKQADGTTNRKYGGTGLGLTISKSFTELLEGEIMIKSTVGEGSNFTLFLPEKSEKKEIVEKALVPDNNEAGKKPGKKANKITIDVEAYNEIDDDRKTIQLGEKFILIIEDDINFCKILTELSHEKGFKCLVALDGETGLHFADFHLPSAIILDLGLPGINGYEVMKLLKDNPKTRHIPIHIISASDKSMEAMKMGAIGYLTKPVKQETLDLVFKKIENIISKPIRKALVVEDDLIMRKSIVSLLDEGNVEITAVDSGEEAFEKLKTEQYECLILDLGLKELSGYDILEKIRNTKEIKDLPVIIYTGQDLSKEESEKLNKYADSIILKGARSFERLLAEATLFLHQVQDDMPEKKQEMLKEIQHNKDILLDSTILIVDDDMRNVFALTSVLESHGVKTIVGRNGKEGLEKLENNPDTNLVLMDIMMPEMDGYEAIEIIRKNKKHDNLPVIALTAKAMKEDRAKCIAVGANDYLAKPVNTDKLISLLRVWLYSKK